MVSFCKTTISVYTGDHPFTFTAASDGQVYHASLHRERADTRRWSAKSLIRGRSESQVTTYCLQVRAHAGSAFDTREYTWTGGPDGHSITDAVHLQALREALSDHPGFSDWSVKETTTTISGDHLKEDNVADPGEAGPTATDPNSDFAPVSKGSSETSGQA